MRVLTRALSFRANYRCYYEKKTNFMEVQDHENEINDTRSNQRN